MVMGGAPSLRFLGWEQGLEPFPLDVGQFASVHVASPPFQLESIARRDQSLQTQPSFTGAWDCMTCEAKRLAIVREYFGEKIMVIHNFTSDNLDAHVDLTEAASGLNIPNGTDVHALM